MSVDLVDEENNIYLDDYKFPISGQIRPRLISVLPGKISMGDYQMSDNQVASSWTMSDQRGGILVEEMDEKVHLNRYYWGNCEAHFKGHLMLGPKATPLSKPELSSVPTILNAGMELDQDWTGGLRSSTQAYEGTYSRQISSNNNVIHQAYQDLAEFQKGCTYTFRGRVYNDGLTSCRLFISDGITTTYSDEQSEGLSFEELSVTKTLDAVSADKLRVGIEGVKGGVTTKYGYMDSVSIEVNSTIDNPTCAVNFNGKLYWAFGKALYKVNDTGDGFTWVAWFPENITGLIASTNGKLYIFLGDDAGYFYMTTEEVIAESDELACTQGVHWNDSLYALDTLNNIKYSDSPDIASPTFTEQGTLDMVTEGSVQKPFVYRDAGGNQVIYAITQSGVWVHDADNSCFLETDLRFPEHENSGLGVCKYNEAMVVSAGLAVKKYVVGQTATIADIGLDIGDGLPSEYQGEISILVQGTRDFYAFIDSSLTDETAYSSVAQYTDLGWQVIWKSETANQAFGAAVVSGAYKYRLWWAEADTIYYTNLARIQSNPKKLANYEFNETGDHITGNFNGSWVGRKLALGMTLFCKDMTETEKVTVYYRYDHTYTNLDDGWIQLGNPVTIDKETYIPFGDLEEGILFYDIQFKFHLERDSEDDTVSPDILWARLDFMKMLEEQVGWTCRVIIPEDGYEGRTAWQMREKIDALAQPGTLVKLSFANDDTGGHTYRVRLASYGGVQGTGNTPYGEFEVSLVCPKKIPRT